MALKKMLRWGELCQGLMGSEGVVEALPGAERWANGRQIQIAFVALPSAWGGLRMGPLSALNVAVELWGMWRQDVEMHSTLLASGLELGHEL